MRRWSEKRKTPGNRKVQTIENLCRIWEVSVRNSVKPSTYACYITLMEKHILTELGKLPADKLTNRTVSEFLRKKQGQGLSSGTIRLLIVLIKSIVQTGKANGINPGEELTLRWPKQTSGKQDIMDAEEFRKMLEYLLLSEGSFELGLLILLGTGIRVGELCGIKWDDIDLKTGILRVRRTVSRIRNVDMEKQYKNGTEKRKKTMIQIGPPKTANSVRDIPLPQFLTKELRKRQREDGFLSHAYVLTGNHQFMEPRGVQRRFKNLLKKCGVDPVNIHSLRHFFASRWVENGFDSKALSEILGHSSVKITMDIYVHSTMTQKKSYMDQVMDSFS